MKRMVSTSTVALGSNNKNKIISMVRGLKQVIFMLLYYKGGGAHNIFNEVECYVALSIFYVL